jgi:hypothetical protein
VCTFLVEDQFFYIVFLGFCPGGELLDSIVSKGRISEPEAKRLSVRSAPSLLFCPRNLMSQFGPVTISDFGLSRVSGIINRLCRSPGCAPGIPIRPRIERTPEDCWSIGPVLRVIVTV